MTKLSVGGLAKECPSKGAKRIRKRSETVIFSQRPFLVTKPTDEHLQSSTEAEGEEWSRACFGNERRIPQQQRNTSLCNGYLVFTCGRQHNENTHIHKHTRIHSSEQLLYIADQFRRRRTSRNTKYPGRTTEVVGRGYGRTRTF